jgi:molybdenum-dependent DNA-binding transcriptional regulator ModE
MRFDLVDLQLFVAVAETRSITNGAQRVHLALASGSERIKGLEDAFGVALLTRGRRGVELTPAGESLLDHARIVMHNVDAMRGDLVAFSRGVKATIRFLTNTSGLSEYLPKALAAFLSQHPHISIDVEEHESVATSRTPSPPAPPISGSLPNTRCPTASSGYRSAKTAWSWSPRARANWRTGGRSIFARWWSAISSA